MIESIRVLRLIARLNVGGPARHVSYLSSERGCSLELIEPWGHEPSVETFVEAVLKAATDGRESPGRRRSGDNGARGVTHS